MHETLGTILITVCSSAITGFFSWFFTRKRYNVEVDGSKISNLEKSLDFYVKICDDTNDRLAEILEKNESLEEQVTAMKRENSELKDLVEAQSRQIETLTQHIEKLNKSINNLK